MPFAVLVLDVTGSCERVRFVDADQPEFREPVSKARARLANVDELVKLCSSDTELNHSASVSVSAIQERDSVLMVNGYVLPPSARRVLKLMDSVPSVRLKEVVKTVRPLPTLTGKKEGVRALEVGAADIPEFGYIAKPGRVVEIDRSIANKGIDQFLRPMDIVLIVKGSVGKVGIVPSTVPPPGPYGWVAGQSAIVLRSKQVEIDSRAIAMQMRSKLGQEVLKLATTGATIPMIPLKMLMELPVFVPDAQKTSQAIMALQIETHLQAEIDKLQERQAEQAKDLWTLQ